MNRHGIRTLAMFCTGMIAAIASAAPRTEPPPGLREAVLRAHALVGGTIVVSPTETIENGTLVLRDGVIEAVGAGLAPPADARVWNARGKTLYAGLIDAYGELSSEQSASAASNDRGAGYWNANVVPQASAQRVYSANAAVNKKLRSQGITARLVAPSAGIIKGTSVLVSTGDGDGRKSILKDQVALHLKLTVTRGTRGYPNSPMGALTLVRQAFYDAGWYDQAWSLHAAHPELERPERSDALSALQTYLRGKALVVIDASNELYFLRADRVADEFDLNAVVRGSGHEYRRLDAVRDTGRAVIVPLSFPKPPNVATPESARDVSLDRLMHWDLAPENPGRLAAAGVTIALTSHGLADAGTFLKAVRKAVKRGLQPEAALAALTINPAEIFGADQHLGTLAAGKAANVVVTDGPLFDEQTKVLEVWTDGQRHEIRSEPLADLRGTWTMSVATDGGQMETFTIELSKQPEKLAGKITRGDKSTELIAPQLAEAQFVTSFRGKPLGYDGIVQISGTLSKPRQDSTATEPAEQDPLSWLGVVVWADGQHGDCTARQTGGPETTESKKSDETKDDKDSEKEPAKQPAGEPETAAPDADKAPPAEQLATPVNFPLGAFGRAAPPEQPAAVVWRNATIWTNGPQGRLENADLLVTAGKIAAVGANLEVPAGALVVDAEGKHLSAGIIDCHSHAATDGGVNESAQTITAEVRIGDFIDPTDINIYRQMAGGVTAANILHGSANTIGGQNQVVKFRWGALPEEMKLAEAPPGIKFALGENVKQSNWGTRNTGRYPQSRMGVEQLVRDAFTAARQYRQQWDTWNRTKRGLPPRTDLELEALAEVVEGKRLIHCHSYRQDEILALLRTCEDFGVRIATFQHILEGYKVADAIARHGAGGSSFSDWWAFKFEVYDAIPYNGSLLHNAGVVVSFNSDNAELARRLNLEAAKAVKYGGVPEEEALQFVTLNPARQLGIDKYVGSLEAGKDADLVVWSGSPLSTLSRCEQTWIDGRCYFDRQHDLQAQAEAAALHARLVQRVLDSGEASAKPGESGGEEWPREDLFCDHGHDGHVH